MSELRIPYIDPSRPRFRRDQYFKPRCYEFGVTVLRPEWLWSDEDLRECDDLPRREPGIFLSYRESGQAHNILWCHPRQWDQWQSASVFGDGLPGRLDRSKADLWSHRDFCLVQAAELLRDCGHQIEFPDGYFSPVPRFSPHALEIWSAVRPLGKDHEEIFGKGFAPSKNPGGLQ